MKKERKKYRRHTSIQGDKRRIRMKSFRNLCILTLPVVLYLSYTISGLYGIDHEFRDTFDLVIWCLHHPQSCWNGKTLPVMALGLLLWIVVMVNVYNRLNYNLMHGEEYGSAKWGNIQRFNEKYASETYNRQKKKEQGSLCPEDRVLSENVRFRYDSNTLRNNNTFVVGGSGAGKTSFFLTPNLLNLHGCNIYTDPKGTLVEELGPFLEKQKDTEVYAINMCEMEKSMHINPFLFIRKKSDITKLIQNLIQSTNTANIKNSSQDPFWERAEKMFLESIFLYVWMECPKAVWNDNTGEVRTLESNWASVLYLIEEAQFTDDDTPPALDGRMAKLEKRNRGILLLRHIRSTGAVLMRRFVPC